MTLDSNYPFSSDGGVHIHTRYLRLGVQSIEHANVLSEKLISLPWVVQKSQFLEEMALTHNILMSVIFRSHLTPPLCLKMTKCAIFSTFWESHLKHTPKVGVHREKFNIGNVAQNFFPGFHKCTTPENL